MPSSNPVDYGADPCGNRNSAWAINECLIAAGRCDFPEGTFLIGSSPGALIVDRVRVGGVGTFNTAVPHGLIVGEKITLYGFTDPTFNGTGPAQFGFEVLSTPTPTSFTLSMPGPGYPDAPLVVQDGWINLVGGGYTSSIILGYPPVLNNVAFTGKGIGKTTIRWANHTSATRNDLFGFNIIMMKTTGNYPGSGVVGAPGAYPGVPVDGANCKNLLIENITFDGNYNNNSVADIQIISVERTAGINTYTTAYPHFIGSQPTPTFTPPVVPVPYSNVSIYNQYISGVQTAGIGVDATFNGLGRLVNITQLTFQRDVRTVLIKGEINASGFATYTKHNEWLFTFTAGDTITITGFADPTLNGTFTIIAFLSASEFYCANGNPVVTELNASAFAWSVPDVPLTLQGSAGVNSLYTVAGINHVGENALFQDLQFYNFGVGIADAETFLLKSFLPMTVDNLTKGATVRRVNFGYQGRNFIQGVLYPGSAESNTQCAIGGYSSLLANINVVSRSAGVATYTCVMKHTLRVGDVVVVGINNYVFGIVTAQRQFNVVTFTTSQKHFLVPGNTVTVDVSDNSFDGTFSVVTVINDFAFTVSQVAPNVFPAVVVTGYGSVNLGFSGTLTVLSTPDAFRFTATTGGPNILPGLYLDGYVIMLRSRKIFASGCVFEHNEIRGGPNPINQQSPVTAITVRETDGAEIRYNNFDGFTGTCFYVDSYQHYRTHIHNNSALNISAFIALVVQDWYSIAVASGTANPELYSALNTAHRKMLIENNDVLLTGPASWYFQTALLPLDAVFLINNHDVDRSRWYYPTDYQIPISTSSRAFNTTTHTTASPHELQSGMTVSVVGSSVGSFNGTFTVLSVPTPTTFTVSNPGANGASSGGKLGINDPVQFPWEILPIGFQRTAGVATYTTNKAHHLQLGWHVTIEGFSDPTFNDEVIVTGTPTPTTFTCVSPGPDTSFTSETGNFFRYVDDIQIGCNTVRRLSGNGLVSNTGGRFGGLFLLGRPNGPVAPLDQFFYFDCPEGCLALECDPGPCKPNDYLYRI